MPLRCVWFPVPFSTPSPLQPKVSSFAPPSIPGHDIPPHLRPKVMEPADLELKPLKPGAKINLSSLKMFFSGILS
jgi:hypothetical protein